MKSFYVKFLSAGLISCLGIIVYSNTFHSSFHFDDLLFIVDNSAIKDLHDLQSIWNFLPCRFIFYLTLAINYHYGQLNVFSYHLVNISVHLISALLVWWLARLTLSTPAMNAGIKTNRNLPKLKQPSSTITEHADLVAVFAGLIFVSHPIQTQGVTYIMQRAASMATLFYVASLCFYVKSRSLSGSKPHGGAVSPVQILFYSSSLITAVVAMFCKEIAITLPLVVCLYEFIFLRSKKGINWICLIPLLLTIFIIPITMSLTTKSINSSEVKNVMEGSTDITTGQYLLTQCRVMLTYIRLIFLPLDQNNDYDYPVSHSLFEWPTLLSFLSLIGILISLKYLFTRYRLIFFFVIWFFLTLLPESSFFPMKDVIFEHRLYLPLVGYSLFLACGMYYLFVKRGIKWMVIALTMIVICNSVLTYQRNSVWKDDIILWSDTIRKSPHKARPYNNRGIFYAKQENYTQAMPDFTKAVELDPKNEEAYTNIGHIYFIQGNFDQALYNYNKAKEIKPDDEKNYSILAGIEDKQKDFSKAILDHDKVIELNPPNATEYFSRGNDNYFLGQFDQAISDYTKAVGIDPSLAAAYFNRGSTYDKLNNFTLAMSDYNKIIDLNPKYENVYYNRGNDQYHLGNFVEAVKDYTRAIEIDPKNTLAYSNRAITFYQIKEYDNAWGDVRKTEGSGGNVNPEFLKSLKQVTGQDQ